MKKEKTLKYFSTFTGIGGFELGIQNAYEKTHRRLAGNQQEDIRLPVGQKAQHSPGNDRPQAPGPDGCAINGARPECVGYSEIDKWAIQIYERHFPDHKNYGDICSIPAESLPDFDMLCGGFPCQSFSIAGKRGGFDDTRGTLFFELMRIARAKRPRLLFFENVKGLLSHDGGRTFDTIIRTIDELGYDCQWQVLNSKNFGVAQNRERVFIIGHSRGSSRPKVFPLGELQPKSDLPVGEDGEDWRTDDNQPSIGTLRTYKSGQGFREMKSGVSPTLPARAREDGTGAPIVMLTERRTDEARQIRKENMAEGRDWSPRRGKELVPRPDDAANTLTGGQTKEHLLLDGMRIRRLTPIECERLQSFPDNWTAGLADTHRYKCLGNAVTVNVIEAIMARLLST